MRWFASWHSASTEARRPPVPSGARQVWPNGPPLWVAGQWDQWEIRTWQIPGLHLAAFGACLATDTELAAAVTAIRPVKGSSSRLPNTVPYCWMCPPGSSTALTLSPPLPGLPSPMLGARRT